MNKFIVIAGMVLSTQAAFSQAICTHVTLTDPSRPRTVIQVYENRFNDDCYEARKQCRIDNVSQRHLQCTKVYGNVAPPRPTPVPVPTPRPPMPNPTPAPIPTPRPPMPAPAPTPAPFPQTGYLSLPRLGDKVVVEGHQYFSVIERVTLQGDLEVRNLNSRTLEILPARAVGVTAGCLPHAMGEICVGDKVIGRDHQYNSHVEALFRNGLTAFRNQNSQIRYFEGIQSLAVTKGCMQVNRMAQVCIGDSVRGEGHNYLSTVEGFFENSDVAIRNHNSGIRYFMPVSSLR